MRVYADISVRCIQSTTRMYFSIKKLGVAGFVRVSATSSEVAFFTTHKGPAPPANTHGKMADSIPF